MVDYIISFLGLCAICTLLYNVNKMEEEEQNDRSEEQQGICQ